MPALTVDTRDVESPILTGAVAPSAAAQALLLESHAVAARAFLLDDSGVGRLELPLISGSITCDSGATVRRTGQLTVLAQWPAVDRSRLTPYGSRVLVQRGIRVAPDAIEWITLMTGPIWETAQEDAAAGPAEMTLPLKDEMAIIAADRFDANTSTNTAETVVAAITRLIRRTLPAATVYDLTGSTQLCGKLDMQKDPAGGIAKLAASIGAECYAGRGWQEFVIRPAPTMADPPRWQLAVGDRGNVVTVSRKRTRDRVYNRVVAIGETNDATGTTVPPPSGEAVLTDTTDPTYYGGPFGRATRFYSSPLLKNADQCRTAAAALLEKIRGRSTDISFTSLVNPAIDGGDRINSTLPDNTRLAHIVDSATIPLAPGDTQAIGTRSVELPEEGSA